MSVEGMWKLQSGHVGDPKPLWGGIVVLESGRVFGGDSVMAYLGTYEIDRGIIRGRVRSWNWNEDLPAEELVNVFGMRAPIDYVAIVEGRVEGTSMQGEIWPEERPDVRLPVIMGKIAELP